MGCEAVPAGPLSVPPEAEPATFAARLRRRLLDGVERRIRDFLAAERALRCEVDARAGVPIEALSELIDSGGKRVRPSFAIAGYLAAGGDPAAADGVVGAGAALEVLHTCALIHDDVMDASARRRGAPTLHTRLSAEHARHGWWGEPRRFGEGVAILAGDLALIYADVLMSDVLLPDAHPSVRAAWTELRAELVIGQYMDLVVAAERSADPELSRWIAITKSGRYTIHRPLVIGAGLAGRAELAPAFAAFGDALGEAFQLRDDLIDAFGAAADTGKPGGLDLAQRKMTLLLSLAVRRDSRVRDLVLGAGGDPAKLREVLIDAGVPHQIEQRIDRLVEAGRQALAAAPIEPAWRAELVAMAHAVAYRKN
ncbi:MAG TPA: polyprenyl synthetase family protein [Streptosporangiaceae bacterium]|nr:polyprenyl synthetase family protein [Streptosporangiaceae bacterium]